MDYGNIDSYPFVISDDILLSVFELCAKSNTYSVLKLSHICRHWRALCLGSSVLWSTINVVNNYAIYELISASSTSNQQGLSPSDCGTKTRVPCGSEYQQLRHYLTHSGNRLLDVVVHIRMSRHLARDDELNYDQRKNDPFHRKTKIIARVLARHSHRIRSFKIEVDTYKGASIFFAALRTLPGSTTMAPLKPVPVDELNQRWGQLEDFQVRWTGTPREFRKIPIDLRSQNMLFLLQSSTPNSGSGSSAHAPVSTMELDHANGLPLMLTTPRLLPTLTMLRIQGFGMHWDFFALDHLEELHLSYMHHQIQPTYHQLRRVLSANRSTLRVLSLIDVCEYYVEVPPNSTNYVKQLKFDLPILHTLTLGYVNPLDLFPIVTYATIPSLKTLEIRNVDGKKFQTLGPQPRTMTENEVVYFTKTRKLLTRMAGTWDLSTITSITFVDVQLFFEDVKTPPNPLTDMHGVEKLFEGTASTDELNTWVGSIDEWSYAAKSLIPFDFWQRCVSLTHLVLVRPDPLTLYALYCPAPAYIANPGGYEQDQDPKEDEDPSKSVGKWRLKLPSGKFYRLAVPNLQNCWSTGVSKEVLDTFITTRDALVKRCLADGGQDASS